MKWRRDTILIEPEFVIVVTDTTMIEDYIQEVFTINKLIVQGGYYGWVRIACANDLNFYQIISIQRKLKLLRYYKGEETGWIDQSTKMALGKFQKENGLIIGGLTKETLDELDVSFIWSK